MYKQLSFILCWIVFYCVDLSQFIYLFICWWFYGLSTVLLQNKHHECLSTSLCGYILLPVAGKYLESLNWCIIIRCMLNLKNDQTLYQSECYFIFLPTVDRVLILLEPCKHLICLSLILSILIGLVILFIWFYFAFS